jgi:hypothetical protein
MYMSTSHNTKVVASAQAEAALRDVVAILADKGLATPVNGNTAANDPRPLSSWLRPVQSGR